MSTEELQTEIDRLTRELAEEKNESAKRKRRYEEKEKPAKIPGEELQRLVNERDSLRSQLDQAHREAAALRRELSKIAKLKRWTHEVVNATLMPDRDGPWVMVDHTAIHAALSADAGKGFASREVLEKVTDVLQSTWGKERTDQGRSVRDSECSGYRPSRTREMTELHANSPVKNCGNCAHCRRDNFCAGIWSKCAKYGFGYCTSAINDCQNRFWQPIPKRRSLRKWLWDLLFA